MPLNPLVMLKPGLVTGMGIAGQPVRVANSTMGAKGGIIVNPLHYLDQGISNAPAESLYVNLINPPNPDLTIPGTVEILPGQTFLTPPNSNVWVNAVSAGHKFTAFFSSYYTIPEPHPVPGDPATDVPGVAAEPGTQNFPPGHVTGLTTVIPSYLYQEYTDDNDLQGFVESQNKRQQDFVDTFNALNLPIYPGPIVQGKLLDWVGRGVYGMSRPILGSGRSNLMGDLNTYGCNWLIPMWDVIGPDIEAAFGYNMIYLYGPFNVYLTDDDTYRRVLTWHFYKTDYNYANIRFFKRRIWRFLFGKDGLSPEWIPEYPNDNSIADTEQISITFGVNRNVTIRFVLYNRLVNKPVGGAMCNAFGCNGFEPAWGIPKAWDIGVDPTPSGGGVNWQFNTPITHAQGDSSGGTTTMAITLVSGEQITPGMSIMGVGVPHGTYVVKQLTGAQGYDGDYQTNWVTTITTEPITLGTNAWTDVGGGGAGVAPGGIYMNDIETTFNRLPPLPFMDVFKQAMDLGVLEMPYQFNYTCNIG